MPIGKDLTCDRCPLTQYTDEPTPLFCQKLEGGGSVHRDHDVRCLNDSIGVPADLQSKFIDGVIGDG